jgi:hypothetical protein
MLKKPREGKGIPTFARKKLPPLQSAASGPTQAKRARSTGGAQAESGSLLFLSLFPVSHIPHSTS